MSKDFVVLRFYTIFTKLPMFLLFHNIVFKTIISVFMASRNLFSLIIFHSAPLQCHLSLSGFLTLFLRYFTNLYFGHRSNFCSSRALTLNNLRSFEAITHPDLLLFVRIHLCVAYPIFRGSKDFSLIISIVRIYAFNTVIHALSISFIRFCKLSSKIIVV